MSSFTWTDWTMSGTMINKQYQTGNWGLSTQSPAYNYSAALISNLAVPDGSSNYLVKMKLRSSSLGSSVAGGILFLRASSDTSAANPNVGTYYRIDFSSSDATVTKRVGGVITTLGTYGLSPNLYDGATVVARVNGSQIIFWAEPGSTPVTITDSSITSGKPGVGLYYTTTKITEIYLGPISPPTPIDPSSISTSSFSNRVDIQWSGLTNGTYRTTLSSVTISRGGSQIGALYTSTANSYSDTTVSPSTTYNYSLTATDTFGASTTSSFSVTTPPSGSVDPRRVGLRNNGAY